MIKKEILYKLKKNYIKNNDNKVRERILNKVGLIDLISDKEMTLDTEFNIELETHGIMNQKESGRCWLFGGLNILREQVIKKCNLNNFDLSGGYLAFYDKLERFNFIEDKIIDSLLNGKDVYDRYLSDLLKTGVDDGGYYTGFANLVKKYGIVPRNVFPETYQSSNTAEINQILTRLLKRFYIEVEHNLLKKDKIKQKYLEYAYKIISNLYGEIVDKFDFEYKDKDGKYHIDKNITPKLFYKKYVGLDLLTNYVEVYSYEDDKYKVDNLYEIKDTSRIVGTKDNIVLNVSKRDMKNLLLKQLKNKELVYFSTSTPDKILNGIWTDTFKRYGDIFEIDLELNNNDILKTNDTSGEHVMIFTGVNIINGKPVKWKVENSWGEKEGDLGYFIADDDWVNKYVFNIVINKKYLTKKQLSLLKTKPIKIDKYYSKF